MILDNPNKIFDTIDNGIILLDENLNIIYWNKWLELKAKIDKKDILDSNILDRFTNINKKIFKRKVKVSLSLNTQSYYSVEPHRYLIDIKLSNITNQIYKSMQQKVTIVPYDIEKKYVCLYIYDQTIQSEINYRLQEHQHELEIKIDNAVMKSKEQDSIISEQGKLASMGEMIGNIAHQWRQPLNALSGHIQFLDDDYDDKLVDKKYIDNFIISNMKIIRFMSNTIDDFRNFFKTNKEKSLFSVRDKINETLSILSSSIKESDIKININTEDFIINSRASEFQQVILNIITNAKDALNEKAIDNKIIEINIHKSGIVTISDNAQGIPQGILNRIFEPYFTTKEKSSGTGIGLYMSKRIIEDSMGGEITVSNISIGAEFKIKLNLE